MSFYRPIFVRTMFPCVGQERVSPPTDFVTVEEPPWWQSTFDTDHQRGNIKAGGLPGPPILLAQNDGKPKPASPSAAVATDKGCVIPLEDRTVHEVTLTDARREEFIFFDLKPYISKGHVPDKLEFTISFQPQVHLPGFLWFEVEVAIEIRPGQLKWVKYRAPLASGQREIREKLKGGKLPPFIVNFDELRPPAIPENTPENERPPENPDLTDSRKWRGSYLMIRRDRIGMDVRGMHVFIRSIVLYTRPLPF